MRTPETRLTDLEIALTHQQAMLEDLSDLVRALADRADRLERLVEVQRARLADLEETAQPAADQRPPHW